MFMRAAGWLNLIRVFSCCITLLVRVMPLWVYCRILYNVRALGGEPFVQNSYNIGLNINLIEKFICETT